MAKKNNTKRKLVGLVSEESGIRQYYTKKNLGRNEVKEKKR